MQLQLGLMRVLPEAPLVAAQWQSTASSRKVSWFEFLWLPTFQLFSFYNSLYFYFQCETRYFKHNPVLWYSKTHFRSMYCSSHLYRCCAILQPRYCCGDYNCGHWYCCTYCWISGWGSGVPLHQLPPITEVQAWVILPPTAEGGVSLQSTATNWSRVWGGSWTETEQVLWNL